MTRAGKPDALVSVRELPGSGSSTSADLVAVLGMHRSGTSAMTRGLQALGFALGDNLMPPVEGNNPKGFFEDRAINQLNIKLLARLGRNWDAMQPMPADEVVGALAADLTIEAVAILRERLAATPRFGLKDPRLVRLMPFWTPVFDAVAPDWGVVVALRHPLSVAKSLGRRDGFVSTKSYYLWLAHMLDACRCALRCQGPVVVIDYDRLLDDPMRELKRIATGVGASEIDSRELELFTSEFLEQRLRHSRFTIEDMHLDPGMPDEVKLLFDALSSVARDEVPLRDKVVRSAIQAGEAAYKSIARLLEFAWERDRDAVHAKRVQERLETELRSERERSERLRIDLHEASTGWSAAREQADRMAVRVLREVRGEGGQLVELHNAVQSLEAKAKHLTTQRDDLQQQLDSALLDLGATRSRLAEAENDLAKAQSDRNTELSRIQSMLEDARASSAHSQRRASELEDEARRLREEHHIHVLELAELSRQLLAAQDREAALANERASLVELMRSSVLGERSPVWRLRAWIVRSIANLVSLWSPSGRRVLVERRSVRQSRFFDPEWYVRTYPDVLASRMSALDHFVWYGARERRSPGPGFSTRDYLTAYPDVAEAGVNALAHFERHGRREGRVVKPHVQ